VLTTLKDGKEVLKKIEQASTQEKRAENAQICVATLKLSVPTVIDREDNRVNAAYAAWPDRLFVVGANGRIAYKGGQGPGGFKPAEVEEWLKKNTRRPAAASERPSSTNPKPAP
jgi:iodothyronine deiodinase-like protein